MIQEENMVVVSAEVSFFTFTLSERSHFVVCSMLAGTVDLCVLGYACILMCVKEYERACGWLGDWLLQ